MLESYSNRARIAIVIGPLTLILTSGQTSAQMASFFVGEVAGGGQISGRVERQLAGKSVFYISQLFRFLARTVGRPVYDDCSVHRFSRCAFIALSIFNHSSTKTLLSAVTTDTTVPIRPVVSVVGLLNTDIDTL